MKWFYISALLGAAVLSLAPFYLLKRQDTSAFEGKVVSYSTYGAKVRSIDPATAGDTTSAGVQGGMYESLYSYHFLKRPVELEPQLAAAMPGVSPDGLTYTFGLKGGVKYCRNDCFGVGPDGQAKTRTVRAADFVLAFKRIADYHITTPMSLAFIEDKLVGLNDYRERTRSYDKGDFRRYDELDLEGVQALDELTLRIRLTKPFPQLLYVLALNNYAPIPRELIEYHLASRPGPNGREPVPLRDRSPVIHSPEAAVGTGAYFLKEFVSGGRIVLSRNPDFRHELYPCQGSEEDRAAGRLADCGKPVPFVDIIYMEYVPEEYPMWKLFLSRRVDRSGIPRQQYSQVISPSKELTDRWAKQGIGLIKYSDPAVYWFAFNMEDRVLGSSKSLRQALCLGFSVEKYIEQLHNGRGIRAVNTLPTSLEAHDEAGPGPYARFDLDEARKKLAQAHNELEASGVIGPGEPIPALTLDLGGRDEEDRRMGEFAQRQFDQLGIKLKIELNDWPTLQAKVENKQTQMYSMGWHADYPDPENFLQLYYTPNIKRGTNNTNYSNPEFDRLYEQAAVMLPGPRRRELYVKMVRMLNEDCPALLLSEPISFVLVHPWMHNLKPHPFGYGFAKYASIDVEARRRAGGR